MALESLESDWDTVECAALELRTRQAPVRLAGAFDRGRNSLTCLLLAQPGYRGAVERVEGLEGSCIGLAA